MSKLTRRAGGRQIPFHAREFGNDEQRDEQHPPKHRKLANRKRRPAIKVDNTPKHVEIRTKGFNIPEAKESDRCYISMRVKEWRGGKWNHHKKIKSKMIRGSDPEWNQDFSSPPVLFLGSGLFFLSAPVVFHQLSSCCFSSAPVLFLLLRSLFAPVLFLSLWSFFF